MLDAIEDKHARKQELSDAKDISDSDLIFHDFPYLGCLGLMVGHRKTSFGHKLPCLLVPFRLIGV